MFVSLGQSFEGRYFGTAAIISSATTYLLYYDFEGVESKAKGKVI